jgi:hypothetical protein
MFTDHAQPNIMHRPQDAMAEREAFLTDPFLKRCRQELVNVVNNWPHQVCYGMVPPELQQLIDHIKHAADDHVRRCYPNIKTA